jgi:hypothetical protein
MEIKYGPYVSDKNKILVRVDYYEQIDDLGYSGTIEIWVSNVDSQSELKQLALQEAKAFLQRALLAHSS